MPGLLRYCLPLLLFGIGSPALLGAETNAPLTDAATLIERLDADQFSDRQAASDQLSRLGSAAFPALEHAAQSTSRETSARAIEILKRHFQGEDAATKQAARQALERLAADSSSRAGRSADLALNPPATPRQIFRPQLGRPAVRIAGANIRINAAPARFVKRVHIRTQNGVKEIEVEENGRKVKVVDDPKEGIRLEVTEKKNGKQTTEKYQAKNADELKQKHPEAHKIYDEVNKQHRGIQIRVGGAALQPVAPQKPADGKPAAGEEAKPRKLREEATKRTLQAIDQHVEQLRRQLPDRPDVQRHIERLEEHRKQIEKLEDKR